MLQLCERAGMVPEEDIEEISSHVQQIASVLRLVFFLVYPICIRITQKSSKLWPTGLITFVINVNLMTQQF
jgi:hypothetical protein